MSNNRISLTIDGDPIEVDRGTTIMEAAEIFFGQSTHVYRPRRG